MIFPSMSNQVKGLELVNQGLCYMIYLRTDCGLALLFSVGRTGSGKVRNLSSAFCGKGVYMMVIEFTHAFTVALHFD